MQLLDEVIKKIIVIYGETHLLDEFMKAFTFKHYFRPIKNPDALLLPLRACNRALLLPLRAVIGPYDLLTIVMNFLMGGPRLPLYLSIFLQY